MIGNSINHQDNRLEHELNHRGLSIQDDDTASINSYGSHKNRPFKDESHKGSAETIEGEEKRDVSKEDLGLDEELDEELDEDQMDGGIIHQVQNDEDVIDEYPADCFPESYYKKFPILAGDEDSPFWQGWGNLRLKTFQLIENKYFETAVITMILMSSLALVSFSRKNCWLIPKNPSEFLTTKCSLIVVNLINLTKKRRFVNIKVEF